MSFALEKLRKQRNQTLAEVAQAVGCDAAHLSRVERGIFRPSPKLAERLAKHFGYAITEIEILYPERFADN